MKTFEENIGRIAKSMGQAARQVGRPSAFYLGTVLEAGRGQLRVSCGGLQLDPEDLYLAAGLSYRWTEDHGELNFLRKGDRVVLLSEDGQDFYLLQRMVKA